MLVKNELTKNEKQSSLAHKELIGEILSDLAKRFGGEATLNQLRIGHYVGLASLYRSVPTNNTDISQTLRIPRSTVSRIVTECIKNGWMVEQAHPDDGRKKMLSVRPDHPQADAFETAFRKLLADFLERYDAGQITKIDCDGNGF
jgi:DNA-binding MarR family transcriptional regulator